MNVLFKFYVLSIDEDVRRFFFFFFGVPQQTGGHTNGKTAWKKNDNLVGMLNLALNVFPAFDLLTKKNKSLSEV